MRPLFVWIATRNESGAAGAVATVSVADACCATGRGWQAVAASAAAARRYRAFTGASGFRGLWRSGRQRVRHAFALMVVPASEHGDEVRSLDERRQRLHAARRVGREVPRTFELARVAL